MQKKEIELRYEKLNKKNLLLATKIQYTIFPFGVGYKRYYEEVNGLTHLSANYILYKKDVPIGIVGFDFMPQYADTIWLSWFGLLEKFRKLGFGKQIFKDALEIAKSYNKKFLRLYTYEVWNSVAQPFYKKYMQIEEYYTCAEDDQYDINVGKCKIFGYSLCKEKIGFWNNKFINIAGEDRLHEESVELLKQHNLFKQVEEFSKQNSKKQIETTYEEN